jgi:flagellar FliL protein
MLVNLNSDGRTSNFLKLSVSLEIAGKDGKQTLERYQPRVVDNFQVYLRELRVEDLQGSAGLQRLREELLLRVNAAVEGVEVKDVLFKEMLVQ